MSFRSKGGLSKAPLMSSLEYSDVLAVDNEVDVPSLELPLDKKLNNDEKLASKQWLMFGSLLKDGPFFTGAIEEAKTGHSNIAPDGIERHSDRYKKVKKIGRTMEEHPYQLDFFPAELYSVMQVSKQQKKKYLSISKFHADGGLKSYVTGSTPENVQDTLEKLHGISDELDLNQFTNIKEDDAEVEEEVDDDFEEEEDDDDDDYNAEKYFDGGDDDFGDDGDEEAAF